MRSNSTPRARRIERSEIAAPRGRIERSEIARVQKKKKKGEIDMYFEFYNENGKPNLCRLTGYKAFITLLFGRKIAKRVPKKDIKFI